MVDAVAEVPQGNYGDARETGDPISLNTQVEGKLWNIDLRHYPFFHMQLLKLAWLGNIC